MENITNEEFWVYPFERKEDGASKALFKPSRVGRLYVRHSLVHAILEEVLRNYYFFYNIQFILIAWNDLDACYNHRILN